MQYSLTAQIVKKYIFGSLESLIMRYKLPKKNIVAYLAIIVSAV